MKGKREGFLYGKSLFYSESVILRELVLSVVEVKDLWGIGYFLCSTILEAFALRAVLPRLAAAEGALSFLLIEKKQT
jgi:hypothetical protein